MVYCIICIVLRFTALCCVLFCIACFCTTLYCIVLFVVILRFVVPSWLSCALFAYIVSHCAVSYRNCIFFCYCVYCNGNRVTLATLQWCSSGTPASVSRTFCRVLLATSSTLRASQQSGWSSPPRAFRPRGKRSRLRFGIPRGRSATGEITRIVV